MNGVRMDIWLWAARFFKTRPMAKRACELGRILVLTGNLPKHRAKCASETGCA